MVLEEHISYILLLSSEILSLPLDTKVENYIEKLDRYISSFDEFITKHEGNLKNISNVFEIELLQSNHKQIIDILINLKLKTNVSDNKAKKNFSKIRKYFSSAVNSKKSFKT